MLMLTVVMRFLGLRREFFGVEKKKPQTEKHKLYAQRQEGARKDVECAFGVLQSRFDIVNRPARLWKRNDVVNIMQACVILHNMIVEDEKELVFHWI